jgi:hypothetical protein
MGREQFAAVEHLDIAGVITIERVGHPRDLPLERVDLKPSRNASLPSSPTARR